MSKDPALLWYWGDWYSGTSLMSRFLKGCYIDLLHAQFNHGRLSLEEIKTCLGADFGTSWHALQKKFKQDENGLFFNDRLEREQLKRQAFVLSRSNNKSGRKKSYDESYDKHMNNHMENENKDDNLLEKDKIDKGVQGEKKGKEKPFNDDFIKFQKWVNENAPNVAKMKEPFTEEQFTRAKKDFGNKTIMNFLLKMHNYKDLTKKNISANLTMRNWIERDIKKISESKQGMVF